MKCLFVTAVLFISAQVFAQDCSKELLKQKPGKWKAGQQGSIVNVSPSDLAKEKAIIGGIHKMIAAGHKPTGCEILYSTVYGRPAIEGKTWIADPYYYSMYILRYLCDQQSADKTKFYVDYATPTTVNITANAMYWLNTLYAANIPADDFRGYLKLEAMPVKKNGYYFFRDERADAGNLEGKIIEYRWLITFNDTLPFNHLTRKEYLLIQKKRLERSLVENPGEKAYLDQFFKNINAYLTKSEAELSKPAVCRWNEEERFENFVEEGSRGSFIAVKPNLAYFRKNLPRSSPQFFTVVYKISHGDPVFEENIDAIKKTVDFAALRNLLGK